MKKIPFYIGVLLVIPIAVEAGRHKRATLHNGYGVGSIMAADMAILHEAIKENIQQQALLVWMDAQGKSATHQAAQAIDTLINNIRYVSIENTWYKIIREVSRTGLLRKAIAGAGAITAFACDDDLVTDLSAQLSITRELAIVVERYQIC